MQKGFVSIDGVSLVEPYLQEDHRGRERGDWARVAGASSFVLGNNRTMSCDSRRWACFAGTTSSVAQT